MPRGYRNRNATGGFPFNISRPVRQLLGRFVFLLLLVISGATIFAAKSQNKSVTEIRTKIVDMLSPVMEVISIPFQFVRDSGDAIQTYLFVHTKNAQLEAENTNLRLQVATLYQAQKENDQLRALLNYVQDLNFNYITAKVVGNTSGPFTRSSLINTGEDDAIMKGQAVIMNGGLVGRIVEVGKKSSRILMLTDINSKIPIISIDSREHSILAGNNTERPKLLYLPKDSKIADGEVMITSGDGDTLPPGLMVGRAVKLPDGSYEVVPFVSWHHIEYVSVLGIKKED